MRMKSAVIALSLSLACLLSSASFAETLTLTNVGGQSTDNVYVYPYDFTVSGSGINDTNVAMSCLNFNREIYFNETWTVTAVAVSSITSAGLDGESQQAYIEDAYLYNQYAGATAQQISDIQFAIWYVMDPTSAVTSESGYDTNAANLVASALGAYNTGNYSFDANDTAYVPVAGGYPQQDGQPQIFMDGPLPGAQGVPPVGATPEPTSLVLLGTGMLGMVAIMRRKLVSAPVRATK
jgi:hypothetical protein